MKRFVAGANIKEAVAHMRTLPCKPIFDYAKEESRTYIDALKYSYKIKADAKHAPDMAFALKYSSFKDAALMQYTVDDIVHSVKYVILDAECDLYHEKERLIYDQIIRKHNKNRVKIYKTYQMYRKDSMNELLCDLETYPHLGIKLVRGAYHHRDKKYNVLFNTKKQVDENYNRAIEIIPTDAHLMIATHNRESIELAATQARPNASLAHLLGMRAPSSAGFPVYLYAPYGSFFETYPYLLRRLYENAGMLAYLHFNLI